MLEGKVLEGKVLEGNALGRALALQHKLEKACVSQAHPLEIGQSRTSHSTHPQYVASALQDPSCRPRVSGPPREGIARGD